MKPINDDSTMEERLNHFLGELCLDWGFCSLSDESFQKLVNSDHVTVDQFVAYLLVDEGFDPDSNGEWYSKIRERIIDVFGSEMRFNLKVDGVSSEMSVFKPYANVAYIGPPELAPGVLYGEIGTILEVYADGTAYEVEFTYGDGSTKLLRSFPAYYLADHSDIPDKSL